MLIVNADDLGRSKAATNAALSCWRPGRITSTSVMVFMEDSERAAELARHAGMDAGLHVNLSESFSGSSVPGRLCECHDRIRRFLTASRYARLLYHPLLARHFRYAFEAQYDEFLRLWGRPPSHFDGHHHLHLATNMVIQHILPAGSRVRRNFSFFPGERSWLNRWYRQVVDRRMARRYRLTDYFFALSHHLTRDRLERVVSLARKAHVELMTHPQRTPEYDCLMSDEYGEALSRVRLASHERL